MARTKAQYAILLEEFKEAIECGELEDAETILKRNPVTGPKLLAEKDQHGRTFLCAGATSPFKVPFLIAAGSNVNTADNDGWTPLMILAYSPIFLEDRKKAVRAALDAGADVHAERDNGWTALMYAIRNSNRDVARMIYKKDPEALNKAQENFKRLGESKADSFDYVG